MLKNHFQSFKSDISGISLPEKFTFPFYYDPHSLAMLASAELKDYLASQSDFEHNFGLDTDQAGLVIGKMFGVLVCQDQNGELGYLWAFSGKLAEVNHLDYFVPTVFDMLDPKGFFKKEEEVINSLNRQVEILENQKDYLDSVVNLQGVRVEAAADIKRHKDHVKSQKKVRNRKRTENESVLTEVAFVQLLKELNEESQQEGILLKKMTAYWNYKIIDAQNELKVYEDSICKLKEERKQKSAALQQKLFAEYSFLNQYGKKKSLGEIFDDNPPAGAGECAAPKLLHFAFKEGLKPICIAEFWWGQSPKSEVRKHGQFYAACKSKCEPILLGHMLEGIDMDDNPFLENPAEGKDITVVFEDEFLAVINKPAEFLSVPGKEIQDSVYQRVKLMYPNATGPLIVHRLDMSTSGLMLIAKTEKVYVMLQHQFINRTVKKCYEALLDGVLVDKNGFIDLPLRVDLDDRPRQLVCYEYGKQAQTEWELIAVENGKTRVHFYPITGRTHQLRVHASHPLGLNTAIVGDDLYGTKSNRLYLHAKSITFKHPVSHEEMKLTVEANF
ncbi:RluA family pseudouridine synthase [Flavobacterium amniphilum]|uniref:RluA family pseudouridine synthase n=1 Tax=Flavobacterium amniphilum TaxID=1834035 RepID=UPI002029CC32|nr:RluA family pseudouridine synthase [Flavobacterium amniphilum]MCL9805846.1 RluA family pseudouridine synthase [Flavobacterium amniphilum]